MQLQIDKPELRVFYGSDFHADFWKIGTRPFFDRINPDDYDLFIFAGDVGEWVDKNCRSIYKTLMDAGKTIVMVPGNHEFYDGEYHATIEDLEDYAHDNPNFYLLHNNFLDLPVQKVRIWGGTFWTDFRSDEEAMSVAKHRMNDYRKIFFRRNAGTIYLMPEDTVEMNFAARRHLAANVKTLPEDWRLIVVTHHAPFALSTPKQYRAPAYTETAKMNKAYSNELYDWCGENEVFPDVWIHGHIHDRANYSVEWGPGQVCTVQSNPFGYPGERDHDTISKHLLTVSSNGILMV